MFIILIRALFRARNEDKLSFLDDILFFLGVNRTKEMGIIVPKKRLPNDTEVRKATARAIRKAHTVREKKSYLRIAKNLSLI